MPYYFYSEDHFGRKRKIQEDSQFSGIVEDVESPISHLLLVADGMGGHSAGEIASGLAKSILIDLFVKGTYKAFAKKFDITPNENRIMYFEDLCRQVIYYINNKIKEKAKSKSMGTTCTFALVLKSDSSSIDIIIGHVGDSRAYILRQSKLKQITEDDSIVWQSYKAGRITKDQIRTQKGSNILTNALGADTFENPQVNHIKILADDVLLICSDGLHGLVGDSKIQHICNSSKTLKEIAKRLIHEANFEGGKDNIAISLFSGNRKGVQRAKKKINKWSYFLPIIFLVIVGLAYLIINLTLGSNDEIELEVKTIEVEIDKHQSKEFDLKIKLDDTETWYSNKSNKVIATVQKDKRDSFKDFYIQYKVDNDKEERVSFTENIDDNIKIKLKDNKAEIIKQFTFDSDGLHNIAVSVFKKGNSDLNVNTSTMKINISKPHISNLRSLKPSVDTVYFGNVIINKEWRKKEFGIKNPNLSTTISVEKISKPKNIVVKEDTPFNIEPNDKRNITINYAPIEIEDLNSKLTLLYNKGRDKIKIVLIGRGVKNLIHFNEGSAIFLLTVDLNEDFPIDTIKNYDPGEIVLHNDNIFQIMYKKLMDVPDSIRIIYKDDDDIWSKKESWE